MEIDDSEIVDPKTGELYEKDSKKGAELLIDRIHKSTPGKYHKYSLEQIANLEDIVTYLFPKYIENPKIKKYIEVVCGETIASSRNIFSILKNIIYSRKINFDIASKTGLNLERVWNTLPLKDIHQLFALSFHKYVLGDKTFYLIGETHNNSRPCDVDLDHTVFISGLMKAVTSHFPNRTYDLFTEIDYVRGNESALDDLGMSIGLSSLREMYAPCLSKSDKCERNVRVHYVDYRQELRRTGIDTAVYFYGHGGDNTKIETKDIKDKVIEAATSPKMIKQYLSNEDDKLSMMIYQFFLEKIVGADSKGKDYISDLMDLYAAGRMFRSFKDHKAKNIIYYAGDYHVENIRKLLVHLGATKKISMNKRLKEYSNNIVMRRLERNFDIFKHRYLDPTHLLSSCVKINALEAFS